MLAAYYRLTKPGIIFANVMTAAAGFFLAARGEVDFGLFLASIAGIGLVIASACVINNFIDRDIDHEMARTKSRALVTGAISVSNALSFASVLGVAGFGLLLVYANYLAFIAAAIGYFFYLLIYSVSKRRTIYGTEVGSVAGSVAIVVGYVAAANRFDTATLLLFLAMVFWQMPHFYAIAINRLKDYKAAGLPVLPAAKGVQHTKYRMIGYIVAYIITIFSLSLAGITGIAFAVVMAAMSLAWLLLGVKGFRNEDDRKWAVKLFLFSLNVLIVFSVMLSVDVWLP